MIHGKSREAVRDPIVCRTRAARLVAGLLALFLMSSLAPLSVTAAAPSPHVTGTAATPDEAEPRKLGLKESVKIGLVQLEVTVWPKKGPSDACLGLTTNDFELRVDGKPRPIYAVDSLGEEKEVYVPETGAAAEASGGGLSFVLFFDLWHLDLFYKGFSACPMTKPLAFREARRLVREQFHEGDRLLLVTAAGWPVIHYGWIRTQADALSALDRLEKNRQVMMPRQEHLHHIDWIAGLESLFLALGRYPGRKDVIYLGDDFRFDDVAMKMYEIAARAESNGVVVSAVDLLSTCRAVPGPGDCQITSGGLGCTEFRTPVALNPIARDTGGQLFLADRIDTAVQELRAMRKCRYLVSFRRDAHRGRRVPSVRVTLRDHRDDLTLLAPSSYQTPERAPSKKEQDEALFLLPRFGRGLAAEVAFWPYRPTGKGGRWKTFVMARVERTDDEPWPDELSEITVSVVPHRLSESYGQYRKTITGDDLTAFRTRGGTRLMLFPVDDVRPGDTTVDVTATSNVEEISANIRKSFDVPEPPHPGEARPWFLSDRLVRFGESDVMAPSLDDVVSSGQPLSFIAYGCRPKGTAPASYSGRLVSFAGGAAVPVPVVWLEPPHNSRDGCGWLAGRISAPEQPGLWTFEPPPNMSSKKERAAAVEFNVVSTTASTTIPAEVKPR